MRKKVFIAAAVILLLLLCFFGWLQYRQYSSWKIPVHKDIITVARIHTDDLILDCIKEYGFRFSKKIKKKDNQDSDSAKNTGIYFPGNIFIYNISSRLPSTLFCSLPVYDLDDFKAYVKNRMDISFTPGNNGVFNGISGNGKLSILCNKDYACVAYSKEKEEVNTVLTAILTGTNFLSQYDILTEKLKKEKAVFTATNGVDYITADLKGKQLILQGAFNHLSSIQVPGKLMQRDAGKSATASFFANLKPLAGLFEPSYTIKQYSIETDSILHYFHGYADVTIGPPVVQSDTITTYDYDDNFEKTAKQTITEVKVPSIHISLLMNPGIVTYLQKRAFITDQLKLNKEIFPLYNVTTSFSAGMLHFSTKEPPANPVSAFKPANNFAEVNMDLRKTIGSVGIPSLQEYVKNIRGIKVTGKKVDSLVVIDANIDFEHAALRDIINIIKN